MGLGAANQNAVLEQSIAMILLDLFVTSAPVANLKKIFTIVNYDSRGVVTRELPILQL